MVAAVVHLHPVFSKAAHDSWFTQRCCLQIDHVLQAHPDVAEAAAFPAPDGILGQVVHAAVALRSTSALSKSDAPQVLKQLLQSKLEAHKVLLQKPITTPLHWPQCKQKHTVTCNPFALLSSVHR